MKNETTNSIAFDPNDFDGMISLMDQYGDSEFPFTGKNEEGEDVLISISHESIVVTTYQKNGWTRLNWYYPDGTKEETFDGRWNR